MRSICCDDPGLPALMEEPRAIVELLIIRTTVGV